MSASREFPSVCSSIRQARADRPEQPDCQIERLPSTGTLRLIKVLESAFRRSVDGISHWRRRRTAIRELQALSDHHLKDIGLDRSQIVSTVEEMIETNGQTATRIARREFEQLS
jgi:uncharacterized protein YjiS (DUF1127 family)